MKRYTLTGLLALCLAVPAAFAGDSSDVALTKSESPDGAWVVRLESPFVREQPAWMPLRIDLEIAGGKPVQAVASAIHLNLNWHPVDVSGLRLEAGRLTGSLAVSFQADDYEKAAIAAGNAKQPDASRHVKDSFAGLPPQVLAVDIPLGTITGAAPGTAKFEKDVVNPRQKPLTVAARAWRPVPVATGAPRHVEFQIVRWDSFNQTNIYDGQQFGALLLRCTLLPDGSTRDWICLQGPERYQLQTADLLWSVENARVTLNRGELSGTFDLAPTKDEKLRGNLPKQPLTARLKARLIGTGVAGTAELAHATPLTSAVLGRVRTQPFARHADRTPRTWAFSAEADPALIAAAEKEASTPVRPGEPGKRWFWSESAMYGGCDIFQLDGKKVVAEDRLHGKPWDFEDFEVYRTNLIARCGSPGFTGIAPPTLNLPAIPGAVQYRFNLFQGGAHKGQLLDTGKSFTAAMPWASLAPLWQEIPVNEHRVVRCTALDAAGKPLGEPVSVPLARNPAFQGPYFKALPRTCREAALLSARWMCDNPANTALRLNHGTYNRHLNQNGDAQFWFITYSGFYAGLTLAQTSPDPAERQYGLDLAITVGETWLRSVLAGYLGDTYKGWAFDQWVYGTCWLDLYRLTGDPRWRDLVLEHAKRLCSKQLPSGTWGETAPEGDVPTSVDAKTGIPMIISIQGPSMQQWDPSSTLYYLGRIRKELKTDDFRATEDKAWQWLVDNSIARFDWRRQGPGESTAHKQPWWTIPDCALQCYEYLALDLPGRKADPALMEDLLRWCEERAVDWRRQAHPTQVFPYVGAPNRDTQLRLARACARQAQRTGSALWKAKAQALAGAMLTAQFPTTGQIPTTADLKYPAGCGDGGNRGEYATMALLDLAELWEPAKP